MPGLLDIASTPESVEVRGVRVDVFGISAAGIAYLFRNFPEIKAMLSGKQVSLDVETLTTKAPKALAAIIACGTGNVGDAKAESVAANLGVDAQAMLLGKILELTFPRGLGPFAADLQRLAETVGGGPEGGSKAVAST